MCFTMRHIKLGERDGAVRLSLQVWHLLNTNALVRGASPLRPYTNCVSR